MPRNVACLRSVTILVLAASAASQDWPMYRADASRSAYTRHELPRRLQQQWHFRPGHRPTQAWPRQTRLQFDSVFQPVVAAGRMFFGSSTDGFVRAVDVATGRESWRFATEGPIRFAPAVAGSRLLVTSDDGHLYCLAVADGRLLWKRRGGSDARKLLGNGSMISRWPARGGAVVKDGIVYFAAGIWQSEGIFIYALKVETGEIVWLNDDAGSLYMKQPHGGANAESGVSAQGHLVATEDLLLVPTGRAVPAAFDLRTGAFRYYHLQKNGHAGGSATMASGKYFFNSGVFFDAKTGAARGKTGATAIAGLPDGIVTASRNKLSVYRWVSEKPRGKAAAATVVRKLRPSFEVARAHTDQSVVVAGSRLVAGGPGLVSMIDLRRKAEVWSSKVEGTVLGMAVAGGRLFAATDRGGIYCFGAAPAQRGGATRVTAAAPPPVEQAVANTAQRILTTSGVVKGYCVDLGCGDGALIEALLRSPQWRDSAMRVVAIEDDPQLVAQARARLIRAGLYGSRAMVYLGSVQRTPFPNWFANLVVSCRSMNGGVAAVDAAEAARLQRPHGGVVCLGKADSLHKTVRGALPGEGEWTHQYADPANSVCSDDAVQGPLGVLWFRDVAQDLTQRHGRGPAPLYRRGRLFSLGLDELVAVDAYNGTELWRYPLPGILRAYHGDHLMGTAGTHGVYCLGAHSLYVRLADRCLRLDPATGAKLGEFHAPKLANGKAASWGYIACQGDRLLGSLQDDQHVVTYRYIKGGDMKQQLTESRVFFALDAVTGELLWRYDAEHSLRHNAIAVARGRVLLIDRPRAEVDRLTRAEKKARKKDKIPAPEHAGGALVALDLATGAKAWERSDDIFGTLLAVSDRHQAIMMSYQPTRFRLDSELGGRLAVFDLGSGKRLWQHQANYQSRPLINDATIYAQGGAWDLRSGAERKFDFQRSYGCGILASGRHTMVYRSATLGYFDLDQQTGNEDFGGIRPGCWINAIPAGGMVLVPDGTAGCRCSYQNKTWLALRPDDLRPPMASPAAGTHRGGALQVSLQADAGAAIHYTLDGSTPTLASARYRDGVRLDRGDRVLKARAFRAGAEASRVATFEYNVDPSYLPLGDARWRVWDVDGQVSGAPSKWQLVGGEVWQTSNIFSSTPPHTVDHPLYGTLRTFQPASDFRNGEIECEIRSDDDDGVGLAFRLRDPSHHYLLHLNRQRKFRALARRDGDSYTVLAKDQVAYPTGRWMRIGIHLDGAKIRVLIDGQEVFKVRDKAFRAGTLGLFCWGSDKVRFRRVKMVAR